MFELITSLAIAGERATGTATIPADLPMLADHFPERPILPGTWLVELAAQIAGPLVEQHAGDRWAMLAIVREAKLVAPVPLPATLAIAATLGRIAGELATAHVAVHAGTTLVLRGELAFALIAADGHSAAAAARAARLARWMQP